MGIWPVRLRPWRCMFWDSSRIVVVSRDTPLDSSYGVRVHWHGADAAHAVEHPDPHALAGHRCRPDITEPHPLGERSTAIRRMPALLPIRSPARIHRPIPKGICCCCRCSKCCGCCCIDCLLIPSAAVHVHFYIHIHPTISTRLPAVAARSAASVQLAFGVHPPQNLRGLFHVAQHGQQGAERGHAFEDRHRGRGLPRDGEHRSSIGLVGRCRRGG